MSDEADMRIHEVIGEMADSEVFFPVRCPICLRESLTGFRISVIADALESSEIRLYSNCHVMSWDASEREVDKICGYLYAMWTANPGEARREMGDLDGSSEEANLAFIDASDLDEEFET
jgi:hypothetical protein